MSLRLQELLVRTYSSQEKDYRSVVFRLTQERVYGWLEASGKLADTGWRDSTDT